MRAKFRLSRYFGRTRQPVLFDVMGTPCSTAFSNSEQVFRQLGGNAGNLAFVHAIKRHLVGLSARANVNWRSTPEQISKAGDICVIPCANQFGPHYDFGGLAKRLEKISTSFVAIGLGTQSSLAMRIPEVPEGTVRWLRRITELAPSRMANVGVRGEFSRRVLETYGFHETSVIGCPSHFLNPSTTLGRLISERTVDRPRHVAVAAGHPGWQHLSRIEQSLAQIVSATNGAYVCQSPFESLKMGRGEIDELTSAELERCHRYIGRDLSMSEFKTWARSHAIIFFDVSGWMEFLRRFDFVVGTRIHGTVLGLQSGVPALCIATDSRTLELCQTMRVPYIVAKDCVEGLKLADLSRLFSDQFDAAEFDANRHALAKAYCAFLEGNGLTVTPEMKKLAA